MVLLSIPVRNVTTNQYKKGSLNRHIQAVHEGIKHLCPYCDYQATTKDSLKKHIKSVHEGKKHPCPYCDYQATTKGSLKRHIKSAHESM